MEWWEHMLLDDDEDNQHKSDRRLSIIIYDIIDDKRRRKMVKCLESFGIRVQKSAFECMINNTGHNKLVKIASKIIGKDDLLRIYRLSADCSVECWGNVGRLKDDDFWVI